MFSADFSAAELLALNLPSKDYRPFPRYEERERWAQLSNDTKAMWIEAANKQLDFAWPPITAEMYLEVRRTGALKPHWDRFRERRSALGIMAVAECIEGKGRFIAQIINGIFTTCEETAWITPLITKSAGYDIVRVQDREVDLCSSETGMILAWIDYLLGDRLEKETPRIRPRIREAVREQVLRPYMDRDDYWWMGFTDDRINNWNPWCNSNVLMCLFLLEDDDKARADAIFKVLRSLDCYVETYSPDGCCDEGPMYWGAAGAGLFLCLDLLYQASGGRIDFFENEKLRLIGEYIKKVHIDGDWFVDYADGDAHVPMDGITYSFGKALNDKGIMALGARAEALEPRVYEWFHMYQYLQDMFIFQERTACPYTAGYLRDAWLWHTGVMTARELEGSPQGFFLSAKAGNNIESHNHNDIGNFIVYSDGKPVIIDIGTEEYTVKTFSPQRFDIWYLQSQYHNCPEARGVMQHDGREFCAKDVEYICTDEKSGISMELKEAYPKDAGISSWKRSIALERNPGAVVVTDCFNLDTPTDELKRYLITPVKPVIKAGAVQLDAVCIQYDEKNTQATIEEIPITESRLLRNWGDMLYRIILSEKTSVQSGERILRIVRERV